MIHRWRTATILYMLLLATIAAMFEWHFRHDKHELRCCQADPVANVQTLRNELANSLAICIDQGGVPEVVDKLFVMCHR